MPHRRSLPALRTWPMLLLVVLLLGSLAACSPSASSAPSGAGNTHTVTITGTSFGDDFTISAGSFVVFVNNAGRTHTVTNGVDGVPNDDPLFDIELEDGATSEPIEFTEPGTYDVTCKIHPSMQLTITVE